ncbi:testis-expressed protein 44 [Echinops telfairi]|uniref:Testis-expressed protein 44 n=1 Tax=Echinops telfairi TaxID=9371 RepID=A0ABM0IK72_ECHTE|nr:testis-expressed protein 44 [Echinops telfairi]
MVTPQASLSSVVDLQPPPSPATESQGQASSTAVSTEVDEVPVQPASPEARSVSEGTPEASTEVTALLLVQVPDTLQVSLSAPLVQDADTSQGQEPLQQQAPTQEEQSPQESIPSRPSTPPSPGMEAQPVGSGTGQPPLAMVARNPSAQSQATGNADTAQWHPRGRGSRSPEPMAPGEARAWSLPSSPGGSPPPSPTLHPLAIGLRPLDPSLYVADEENNYMRSMTSLLGSGEGSISSLEDILVWSEATLDMAMRLLATGQGSVTDLLQSPGPGLRSASSLLDNASSVISSSWTASTSSALRTITNMLETVERRTIEGIRSAVRFLTSHLTPDQPQASPGCD